MRNYINVNTNTEFIRLHCEDLPQSQANKDHGEDGVYIAGPANETENLAKQDWICMQMAKPFMKVLYYYFVIVYVQIHLLFG